MSRLKKFRLGFFSLLLAASVVVPLIIPALRGRALASDPKLVNSQQVEQAATNPGTNIRWINAATLDVTLGSQIIRFIKTDLTGGVPFNAIDYSCPASISIGPASGRGSGNHITVQYLTATATQCIATDTPTYTITGAFGSPGNASIIYAQIDATTIVRVDGNPGLVFKSDPAGDPNRFYKVSEQGVGCRDVIIKLPSGLFSLYVLRTGGSNNDLVLGDPACEIMNKTDPNNGGSGVTTAPMAISIPGSEASSAATTAGANNPAGGPGAVDDNSCESRGGPMGWILCPVINALDGALNWVDDQVQSLLIVDPAKYNSPTLKKSWETIRNIAYLILVPVMLVMVIGTAVGIDAFSAYTVKRALPRMVAAVIFIALSWYICTYIIGFFNAVGTGILGVMTGPFYPGGGGMNLSSLFAADAASAAVQWGSTMLTVLAAYFIFTSTLAIPAILILMSLLAGALLFIFVAFIVLLLRQLFILALLLMAPLAILVWIFPGNDGLWKAWWSVFSKLLIMFPLIMGILGAGRIFAWLLEPANVGGATGFSNAIIPVLKLTAYVAPYIMIPFTFKFAGGLFANLSGMVNDRGRGLFDRNKKFRQKQMTNAGKALGEQSRAGKLFPGADPNKFKGRLNARAQRLAHLNRAADQGIGKIFSTGASNITAAIQTATKEQDKAISEDADFNAYAGNDDLGIVAAVIKGGEKGEFAVRRRLMKRGVGVRKVLDDDGNETDEVYRDEDGNMEINDEAALKAATNRIMDLQKAGDRQGAIRQALIETRTFTKKVTNADGTTSEVQDDEALDTNIAHIMRDTRKYGDVAYSRALVKKAGAGGTYYDNDVDAWHAVDMVAGDDGAARAEFAASFRGINLNAGRGDLGGGAFGKTFGFMGDLGQLQAKAAAEVARKTAAGETTTIEVEMENIAKQLHKGYAKHVKENNPASLLFDYRMKENAVESQVLPGVISDLKEARAAAEGKGEDSVEFANYMKALADADNIYKQAQATKPALAKKIGDKLMNLQLRPPARREVQVDTGLLDGNNRPIMRTEVVETPADTVSTEVYNYKNNEVWQRYHSEWQGARDVQAQLEAQREAQARADAQSRQPRPGAGPGAPGPGGPPLGGGPLGGGPIGG